MSARWFSRRSHSLFPQWKQQLDRQMWVKQLWECPLRKLQQHSSAASTASKMRQSCAGNQQPAQPPHVPTAPPTEGSTGFKVSDSWCWVPQELWELVPPWNSAQPSWMQQSQSWSWSQAYTCHQLWLSNWTCVLWSVQDPNTGPALAMMHTPLPCAFTYSPTAEPVYIPGTTNHHYLPCFPIAEPRDTDDNHYSYASY